MQYTVFVTKERYMKFKMFIRQLACIVCICSTVSTKIIVWDLVNVLFKPDTVDMGMHIIIRTTNMNPFKVFNLWSNIPSKDRMRQMINDVLNAACPDGSKNSIVMEDAIEIPLSDVYVDYLAGIKTSQAVMDDIAKGIKHLASKKYFNNQQQCMLLEATLQTIFTPALYAHYMRPIRRGCNLLKRCAIARTADGNLRNEMMILSNWDRESFPLMLQNKQNQQVFKYFTPQNIFISGQFGRIKGLKPYPWVYRHIIAQKGAKPADFVVIDNSPSNIAAARSCGMHALLLKNDHDYRSLEQELKALGVL